MTKKQKNILFFACFLFFFTSTPALVLYYQGYRLNFKERKFVQTGAFYFKVVPSHANILLNGKLKKKTDLFFGTTIIENLMPGNYQVRIEKEGYLPWEKNLEIKEREVTDAKNIFLFPEKVGLSQLSAPVKRFVVSPDNKKIILEKENGNGFLSFELYDIKTGATTTLFRIETKPEDEPAFEILFSPDSKNAFFGYHQEKDYNYAFVKLETATFLNPKIKNTTFDTFPLDPERISFAPDNSDKVFFLNRNSLFSLDLTTNTFSSPFLKEILTYQTYGKEVYYLDLKGFTFKTDLTFSSSKKINEAPLFLKNEVQYQLYLFPKDLFVKEEKVFYWLNQETGSFEKIFEPLESAWISQNKKTLAFVSNFEVWNFFLSEIYDQPLRKKGELVFLTRFSDPIKDPFWVTPGYLMFCLGNKIKIIEMDDRDKLNAVEISFNLPTDSSVSFEKPSIFWNPDDKKIYIIDQKILYNSDPLTR
ncbi:MAG: PEGA domain-containing protein [bacterium]